jgi:hypothetical protein
VFDKSQVRDFKEHWIDIHDPEVQTLRVTNFSNYDLDNAKAKVQVLVWNITALIMTIFGIWII